MHDQGSGLGVVGVFLALLGAGIILDADCIGMGVSMMAVGIVCLTIEARRPPQEKTFS